MSKEHNKSKNKLKKNKKEKSESKPKVSLNSNKERQLNFEGNTQREGEGSMYDKIMRENLLKIFLPLVEEELKIKVKSVHPLPDKQPTTVIRETDSFLLVKTYSDTEPEFILHIEFESSDNEDMIYRIAEYHGIELRKYRLPIKHVVVFLGENKPKMRTKLQEEEVFTGFTLVNTYNFSPQKWLSQKEPSKIIMAILSDYQKQNAAIILEAIMRKLRKVCKSNTELKKFIEQLIIISRMRNLEELTIKISKAMPITIDINEDYLYKLGLKKNAEKVEQLVNENKELVNENKELVNKAKAETEKAKAEAEKAKADKKIAIQKMKATDRFSDKEIMEYLSLTKEVFDTYWKEIKEA